MNFGPRNESRLQTSEKVSSAGEHVGIHYNGSTSTAIEPGNTAKFTPAVLGVQNDVLTIPVRTRRRRRRHITQELEDRWEQHRSLIRQLYLDQEMCLEQVVSLMGKQYNFWQKAPAYKKMFGRWGFCKNSPATEMKLLAGKAYERKAKEGKATLFYIHDRLVDPVKLKRFVKRYHLTEQENTSSSAATPPYVRYVTPPPKQVTMARSSDLSGQITAGSESRSSLVHNVDSTDTIYPSQKQLTQFHHEDSVFDPVFTHTCLEQENIENRANRTPDDKPTASIADAQQESVKAFNLLSNTKIRTVHDSLSAVEDNGSYAALVERLPCGIYKPPSKTPRDRRQLTEQESNQAILCEGGPGKQDRKLFANLHCIMSLSQQKRSTKKVLMELERTKASTQYKLGSKHEAFLQQSLELGLVYEKLSMGTKRDATIEELTIGYHKFWLPSDQSHWTDEELFDSNLPLSDFRLCEEPVNESCICDQLKNFACRNRARMSHRAFKTLQSRVISCYLKSGRIGDALNCLIEIEEAFSISASVLGLRNHILSVLEVLESYFAGWGTLWSSLLVFSACHVNTNDGLLLPMLHATLPKLDMGHQGIFSANIALAAALENCQQDSLAREVLLKLEDHIFQRFEHPKGNILIHQSDLMVSVRALVDHYTGQMQWLEAEAFVLKVYAKCKKSWGLNHLETLQARQLVQGIRHDSNQSSMPKDSVLAELGMGPSYETTGPYESFKVFERFFN
ncbi:hypothetical protein MMC13_008494 [Lambiella insularis]|nr:hypothetical protein [Lambiella insularis]